MSEAAFGGFRDAFIAGDVDRLADAFEPDGTYGTARGGHLRIGHGVRGVRERGAL